MIKANDPKIRTWLYVGEESDFPIQNIPFGVFKPMNRTHPRVGTRIGDYVIDLSAIADKGYFKDEGIEEKDIFYKPFLNDFIALGKNTWRAIRNKISDIFNYDNEEFWNTEDFKQNVLFKIDEVDVVMPVQVGDYTDFYSSIEHATNVGKMFRDPKNALLPNWKYLPVGYHGRASSIVASGAEINRPLGQTKPSDDKPPVFGPSKLLDFELEMAFVTGGESKLGRRISTHEAADYIFGMVLFNDLSARDIQKWEYQPLGPFLSKNFGSVISPWIITLDALEPFKVEGPEQNPDVLPYLQFDGPANYDIQLDVYLQSESFKPHRICRSNSKHLYWNIFQQLAHQTVTGCNIKVGDMYASGTISGPTPTSYGSMLELSWRGSKPLKMPDGTERKFIRDHDTIIMKGKAEKDGVKVGFGECITTILPAVE